MLSNHTIQTLRQLKLGAMADAYTRQIEDPNSQNYSFEERFGLLVDHEWTHRENQRQNRLVRTHT
ncbi:ATP-binding protein [Alicyclobacillus sp. SO9]|uniref:ATP-binding protein n=1 Tax=Alicyclobacillus sp. SO9 TaxID=2665646 RepID=UPI0018E78F66|nr:ATP-binding protein [Alicyclobacillus sp. SO9]QQE78915.1 IstB-like ATP-binding domain-containing protein [Alicyclobacillus sp. SO9]